MTKRFVTYFILTLMLLQSAAGMADAHQLHQSGDEHLTFEASHQHQEDLGDTHTSKNDSPEKHSDNAKHTSQQNWDCHHCCHCHGHFTSAIILEALNIGFEKPLASVTRHSISATRKSTAPLLRPPIA